MSFLKVLIFKHFEFPKVFLISPHQKYFSKFKLNSQVVFIPSKLDFSANLLVMGEKKTQLNSWINFSLETGTEIGKFGFLFWGYYCDY